MGAISIILHLLVCFYGFRLYKILNPVRYWSHAWLLYSVANALIVVRRFIGIFIIGNPSINLPNVLEVLVQIVISILLLVFGRGLGKLYEKYFTNGLNIQSWKEEQEQQEQQKK